MSMYDKNHYNYCKVISLQLIKINGKKIKNKMQIQFKKTKIKKEIKYKYRFKKLKCSE